ncbi:MAG: hypothetical protein EBT27_04425 [Betaproteobacteria bacterium]|nr:hypothetical protein [Betaproteobacteria bacterium]
MKLTGVHHGSIAAIDYLDDDGQAFEAQIINGEWFGGGFVRAIIQGADDGRTSQARDSGSHGFVGFDEQAYIAAYDIAREQATLPEVDLDD